MPRPSGKATISLKGNAKNLPDIYFRELVQLYSRDCRTRGIEEVTIAGYEYACKKFLEYLQEDIRCSDLRQELFDDYQMELATRVKAETVNSYLFKISPVLKFGKERGYITADIQLSHMAYQEHFKDVYTEDEIRKLLARPKTNKFNEYRTWVIVSVFLGTGIRSLELRSIRCKDVNLNEGYIIDMESYTRRVFSMFGGQQKRVSVRFINPLLDTVIERFGTTPDVFYRPDDERHFVVTADVEISNQFFAWVCGFGKRAKITYPPEVVEDFQKFLSGISEMYTN